MLKRLLLASAMTLAVIVNAHAGWFGFGEKSTPIDQATRETVVPLATVACMDDPAWTNTYPFRIRERYCICLALTVSKTATMEDLNYMIKYDGKQPDDYRSRVIVPAAKACVNMFRQ